MIQIHLRLSANQSDGGKKKIKVKRQSPSSAEEVEERVCMWHPPFPRSFSVAQKRARKIEGSDGKKFDSVRMEGIFKGRGGKRFLVAFLKLMVRAEGARGDVNFF